MEQIKIYTKTICPYCIKAKMLLKKLNLKFKEISTETPKDMIRLSEKSGMRTVPQIYIGEKLIGGCDDLFKLHKEGKLVN